MTVEYIIQSHGLGEGLWRDHSYFESFAAAEKVATELANQMVKGHDRVRVIKRSEEEIQIEHRLAK